MQKGLNDQIGFQRVKGVGGANLGQLGGVGLGEGEVALLAIDPAGAQVSVWRPFVFSILSVDFETRFLFALLLGSSSWKVQVFWKLIGTCQPVGMD